MGYKIAGSPSNCIKTIMPMKEGLPLRTGCALSNPGGYRCLAGAARVQGPTEQQPAQNADCTKRET
ncbi:hypothetical protein HRH25_02420 [Flavisolibacter sp. BT320]|nr:hypothetical protein [Flavisolibacter longurius]